MWPDMDGMDQIYRIRDGYLAGLSASQIAAPLGTTRNAVLGLAYRWCLCPANAHLWHPGMAAERKAAEADRSAGRPRQYVPTGLTLKQKAARRVNFATDPATRAAVDRLNAIPFHDKIIEEEMGVERDVLSRWRRGHRRMTPFMLSLVDETVRRFS